MRFVSLAKPTPRRARIANNRAANSRGPRPARLRRILVLATAGALAVVAFGALAGAGYLWRSGLAGDAMARAETNFIARSADFGLTVADVLVDGRKQTPAADVLAALDVQRGQPLLDFAPAAAKARLESLGWVREATVERRFPGTVVVHLTERRPLVLWQRDGKLALVDDTGSVITRDNLDRFADLPIVVGDDAPQFAPALIAMLATEPQLKSKVTAAVRVSGRRWNLRLNNAIDIRLPEEHPELAWKRLAELDRNYGLLQRDIIAIDLRMSDRLFVQLPHDAVHRLRQPGADT
jgi:cell division protein FtsQ